ncbi:MAG: pitrilysin family protein [Ignavibacteria bacterium]|nr:pitrilysin family protein [Ignavibacteria bacterium]
MKMVSINKFVLMLVLSFVVTTNGFDESNKKYDEGKLYRHSLKNGMTVLTMERHIAPLIYHQLTYRVGSRDETLGITGISHVVEHLMFKGTPKYGKGEASKIITKNSGVFNAFTMNDMTSYYEYLPANKINIAFEIESDRMQNCMFNTAEFKSEIEVIKQERRMRTESQANGILQEAMNSIAYNSHPNQNPIIGWPSDLSHISRDDAFKYYKTFYTPNNSFLVLIGDFDTDKMLETVKKYYEHIPSGPSVPQVWASEEPQKVRKSFTLYHADITTPSFRMAFHVPTYQDSDAAPLKLAAMILCEKSRDARLYKRLIEKDQISTAAAGGFGMAKDPPLFQISVSVKADSLVNKAESVVWEEIKNMQSGLVEDHELQKVKNRYKFSQATNYIKNGDIGSRISRYETYFGWDFFKEFDSRVLSVTKEDIQRVMVKYFNPEQVTVGYSYPKEGSTKKKIKTNVNDEDENSLDQENKIELSPDAFYFQPPVEALELMNSFSTVDDEVIKPKPIEPMIKTMKLNNGVTIHTMENHLIPTVSIVGLFETGIIPESLEGGKPGISSFLSNVMNRGTKNLNYEQLSERMAFVPFSFSTSGSYKSFFFQGNSLVENADEMMKTGYDMVTDPLLSQEDIDKVRPRELISARDRFKKTSIKAFYYMFNQLFEDHPITKFNSTEASIKSIQKEDLAALHKKYVDPSRLTILMIGDMTPDEMKNLANKYFGNWKKSDAAPAIIETPKVKAFNKKEIKVFQEKDYSECTINIGFAPFNDVKPEDEEIVAVLNHILAGSALTSRMGIELRDKQGLIYGIKSELWSKSDGLGYWKFNTKTGPKNTEKVIKGIFSEINKLLKENVTDTELNQAKQRLIGLLPFYVETPDDASQYVFEMIQNKQPFNFFDKKASRIVSVTKDDVLRIAKKYFTLDKFIIVVDGPIEENSLDNLINEL